MHCAAASMVQRIGPEVGAGNSQMSAQMFMDGFPDIVNIDLSEVAAI